MRTNLGIRDEACHAAKARATTEGRRKTLFRPAATTDFTSSVTFPIVNARQSGTICVITDERLKSIELEVELERHAASR